MSKEELILVNVAQKYAIGALVKEILNQRSLGLEGAELSDLYQKVADVQLLFEQESYKASPDMKVLHSASMKLDFLLSEFMPKGKIEIGEPVLVPVGEVKLPPRPPVQVFYGWRDSVSEYPTEDQILSSENFFFIPFGGSLVLPFSDVQEWKHAWFALPDTEPLKTNWDGQNSPLNRGEIGGDNLFGNPVHIGAFHYYFTTFPTIFEMPVVVTGGGVEPEVIEPGDIPETITPEPPTLTANDTLNTLTAAHALGNSEILVSVNGAAYVQYTGVINVGDVDRPAGYWKFKIKAAQYRNESAVVNSPEFTKEPIVIPDQYTLTVQVNGVSTYTVYVNGAPIVGNTITVNEGTVLSNITVVRTGYNISPASVPSVTMNQNQTLVFTATEIPVIYPDRILTVVVNGLHEPYQIFIDGQEQTGPLMFPHGTILDDIRIEEIEGYTIVPVEFDDIVMDQNRTVTFTATRITHTLTIDTGGISGVELYFDDVLYAGPLVFNHGEVLENISIHKAGYIFTPETIPSVTMDGDKTVTFTGTAIAQYTLTVNVNGLGSGYTVSINGQARTGNTFTYNDGTVIEEVKVSAPGYTFSPVSHGPITMSQNRSVSFVATEIPMRTLTFNVTGATDYTVTINGVVQPSGPLSFYQGTELNSIVLSKQGYIFSPPGIASLTLDEDTVLDFTASADISELMYMPGFSAYDPKERYARLSQGGDASLIEESPGVYMVAVHRLDFISYIRVPVGGEYAVKVMTNESSLLHLNPNLPWGSPDDKENYHIGGYSGGPVGRNGFYGNGVSNKLEIRFWVNSGSQVPGSIPDYHWVLYRRVNEDVLNIYSTNGITEVLLHSMDMSQAGDGGADYMYLKQTIWDEGYLNYPQQKGCFHELNDTWPPVMKYDNDANRITVKESLFPDTEILFSENGGAWQQFTGVVEVGNVNRAFGYYRFKIKQSGSRPESPFVQSPAFTSQVVPEGMQNVLFSGLTNLSYNSGANSYSLVSSSSDGKAWNPQVVLPVTGSIALYWNRDTVVNSAIDIGFDVVRESRSTRMDILVYLNNSIAVLGRDFSTYNIPGSMQVGYEYRLVCRNFDGERVWTVESSNTDWSTYTVLYTCPLELNSETLYLKMLVIPKPEAVSVNGLRIEYYADSNVSEMVTVTPEPPSLTSDDVLNTLSASHQLGNSEILVSENNGAYTAYLGVISVGNVDRPAGYWKFKIKSAVGRNESSVVESPAFTETLVTMVTLTIEVEGTTDYQITINGSPAENIQSVPEGTVLTNISVTKEGWSFDPPLVASVTMTSDQTISFTATEDGPLEYLPMFDAVDLVSTNPGIVAESSDNIWTRTSNSQAANWTVDKQFGIGDEFAIKVLPETYSIVGINSPTYSIWVDTDAGISLNGGGYPNFKTLADSLGGFVIFKRVSLTSTELLFTKNGVTFETLHTFTTVDTEFLTIGGRLQDIGHIVAYPQFKNS